MMRHASSMPSQPETSVSRSFERLVGLEEVLDLPQPMRAQVLERRGLVPSRVVVGHRQDLVVVALVVLHVEDADRTSADDAAGEGRLTDDDEDVERVAVIGHAALDEAVVARVMDAAVQHPVEHEPMPGVVVLVLVAAPGGDLDDHLDRVACLLHAWSMRLALRYPSRRTHVKMR